MILLALVQFMSCEKEQEVYDFVTFEEIALNEQGFWNGSDNSGGFASGNAFFPNTFSDLGEWGTVWTGFACSNHTDVYTEGTTTLPGVYLTEIKSNSNAQTSSTGQAGSWILFDWEYVTTEINFTVVESPPVVPVDFQIG